MPKLSTEHELYTVTEGQSLPLRGYLVNVIQEIEPPPELVATLINGNGVASMLAVGWLPMRRIYMTVAKLSHRTVP